MDPIMRKALQSDDRDTMEAIQLDAYANGVVGSGRPVFRGDLSEAEWDRLLTRLMEAVASHATNRQMWN